MRGLYSYSRVYRKIILRIIFRMFYKIVREFTSARIHAAPVFAPARIQEKSLANHLCIGFVPGDDVGTQLLRNVSHDRVRMAAWDVGHSACTIGDKKLPYLTFIPHVPFWVIACVYCGQRRKSRGVNIETPSQNYLI